MTRRLVLLLTLVGAVSLAAQQGAAPTGVDAAFASFLQAPDPQAAAAAIAPIVASGAGFDEALRRLRQGRVYAREVPRGAVQDSYRSDSGEFFYALDIPETYDPARAYQVRVQLHGGVGRIESNRPGDAAVRARLAGAEQIYVMPFAWSGAPWWSGRQVDNLRAILDRVKRRYNVDENRVALSGVSDGGTGAYYTAMRDTTPYAAVLPLNGFIGVLANETAEADADLFPNNLVNKPMFIVNGGRDPQYPTSMVDPYIEHFRKGGVDLTYLPQPNAGHDTSWWPALRDRFEQFVTAHPRRPLPDTLTWETRAVPGRAHWLVIDRLRPRRADEAAVSDLNAWTAAAAPEFGIRSAGSRISRVVAGSNAAQIGLKSGDVIVTINNLPASPGTDVAEVIRGFPPGRPLLLTVRRGADTMRVTGRYAPSLLPGEAGVMFARLGDSGRVDLARKGNQVEVRSAGVAAFTLLLSPDQFDFGRPLTVVVNGRTAFEGTVQRNLRTLLDWAARDNDRTMLFGAELHVTVPD